MNLQEFTKVRTKQINKKIEELTDELREVDLTLKPWNKKISQCRDEKK